MYLERTVEDLKGQRKRLAAELLLLDIFGKGFSPDDMAVADRLEVWCSSLNDPGDDFTEYRLFLNDELIATRRVNGY